MRTVKVIKDIIVEEVPYHDFITLSEVIKPDYTIVDNGLGILATTCSYKHAVVTPKAFFESLKLDSKYNNDKPQDLDLGNGEYVSFNYAENCNILRKEEFIVMSPFIKGILGKYLKGVTDEIEEWKQKLNTHKIESSTRIKELTDELERSKDLEEWHKDEALYYFRKWYKEINMDRKFKYASFWQRLKYLFTGEI